MESDVSILDIKKLFECAWELESDMLRKRLFELIADEYMKEADSKKEEVVKPWEVIPDPFNPNLHYRNFPTGSPTGNTYRDTSGVDPFNWVHTSSNTFSAKEPNR